MPGSLENHIYNDPASLWVAPVVFTGAPPSRKAGKHINKKDTIRSAIIFVRGFNVFCTLVNVGFLTAPNQHPY